MLVDAPESFFGQACAHPLAETPPLLLFRPPMATILTDSIISQSILRAALYLDDRSLTAGN